MKEVRSWRRRLSESRRFERFLEFIPGTLTWAAFVLPVVLSFVAPLVVAYFIIVFDVFWLFKSVNISRNLYMGFRRMRRAEKIDWLERLQTIAEPKEVVRELRTELTEAPSKALVEDLEEVESVSRRPNLIGDWKEIRHIVIVPTFKESYKVLEATFEAIERSNFPLNRVYVVLATEERDHDRAEQNAKKISARFGKSFAHLMVTEHPKGIPGEVLGKGPNISYAGRKVKRYMDEQGLEPRNIVVSNIDADHQLHPQYLAYLTYMYVTTPSPTTKTFQPIPVLNNNIWDAPLFSRVIAIGSTFWQMVESMRPRRLRNYSAHAQSLETLIDTDFWSVKTIVEDGHQFWRTYFTYQGDHRVVPLFIPIYGDAVLSSSYRKTLVAQYRQIRRWAWGTSDFPYVVRNMLVQPGIPFTEKFIQIARLVEGHFSWATSAVYLTFVGWLPIILSSEFKNHLIAYTLGPTTSKILTLALAGMAVSVWIAALLLPPRPPHYGFRRTLGMYIQWLSLPISTIIFGSLPAIDAQTRLMLGKYMNTFDVTEKVRKEAKPAEAPLEIS